MKLCWNITNSCNANCLHCFRNCTENPIPLEQNIKIVKKLKNVVDSIGFSGGEALLYDGFLELVEKTKKMGFICSLITNGILLNKNNIENIIKNLDSITFSIEFIDDSKNASIGRGNNYCQHLQEVMRFIKNINPNFIIKVNTVITKENLTEIDNIYNFLKEHKVDFWKLMRFCPYRQIAKANISTLAITDKDFVKLQERTSFYTEICTVIEDVDKIEDQLFISAGGNLCIGQNNEDIMLLPTLYNQSKKTIKTIINKKLHNEI